MNAEANEAGRPAQYEIDCASEASIVIDADLLSYLF